MFNTSKPQRGYRKLVAITLTLATALILAILPAQTQAAAATATARTVTVFRVDGRNADIFRNSTHLSDGQATRRTAPRTNVRIGANDTLITGDNTQVYLNLDTLSLLKMDSNSEVNFELTNNLIGLNLQHGTALVQVAEQVAEQAIESRLGNLVFTVRGTTFTMGHFEEEDIVFIVMLSGSGEIDGVLLEEGQILTSWYDVNEPLVHISGQIIHDWHNDEVDRNIAISEIYLPELDTFTLLEILNNSEYLLENSEFVTEEILQQIPPILDGQALLETETNVAVQTPQRSFSDAQNRWQIAQQNRRAEENNQNSQNAQNGDFDNFVVPAPQPLPILPPVIAPTSPPAGQTTPPPTTTTTPPPTTTTTPPPTTTTTPPPTTTTTPPPTTTTTPPPTTTTTPPPTTTTTPPPTTTTTPPPTTTTTPPPTTTTTPPPTTTTTPPPTTTTTPDPNAFPGTGNGTTINPYIITNVEELKWIDSVANANNHFRVDNNIFIVPNDNFNGISTDFSGNFDGNNHTISGLTAPLFNRIANSGVVRNLVAQGDINKTFDSSTEIQYIGGIAARSSGRIENVAFIGDITVNSQNSTFNVIVGGIVGEKVRTVQNFDTIIGSFSSGTISVTANVANVGGIVGRAENGTIHDVYSTAHITVNINENNSPSISAAGGIIGAIAHHTTTGFNMNKMFAAGDITVSSVGNRISAGGIVGAATGSTATATGLSSVSGNVLSLNSILATSPGYTTGANIGLFFRIQVGALPPIGTLNTNNFFSFTLDTTPTPPPLVGSNVTTVNGTTVTSSQVGQQDFWINEMALDFATIWQWNGDGNLPTLRNVGGQAITAVPQHQSAFAPLDFDFEFTPPTIEYTPPTDSPTLENGNDIIQEGGEEEFWDIDLDNLLTPTPEVDFDLPAGQAGEESGEITITMPEFPTFEVDEKDEGELNGEESETDETEENETEPNGNEEPPTDSETNNEEPQEGSEDEFWDIDLDDLLNPNPEVDDNLPAGQAGEETDEITTPEFPTVGVDEDEEDEGNNEDYTEEILEPDKTEPEDTANEENEEEEPDND